MKRIAYISIAFGLIAAAPAHAVTNDSGQILITQAAAQAGSVTPGDAPGFPVTISAGGSYRLASNLTVTTLVNGIEVRANEVTIDLGGFTLAGSGAGRNGITSFNRSLTVENGTVRGFTLDGIRTLGANLSVDRMLVSANGRNGVYEDYSDNTTGLVSITNTKISNNTGIGITCYYSCFVQNSQIFRNDAGGGNFPFSAVVLGSDISFGAYGLSGDRIAVGDSFIHDNTVNSVNPVLRLSPSICGAATC